MQLLDMQLMELQPGMEAVIRRLEGGRPLLSRLAAMGFTPGAVVTMDLFWFLCEGRGLL